MKVERFFKIICSLLPVVISVSCARLSEKRVAVIEVAGQGGGVLATVGEVRITEADFMRALARVPSAYREKYMSPEGKGQLLRSLIEDELFYGEGRRLGIADAADVEAEVEDFRKRIVRERVGDWLKRKVIAKDADIEKYYRDNAEKYTVPEKLRLSIIMIGLSKDASPEEVRGVEEKAGDIIERLIAGEEFEWLARQLSEHSSGKDGGDLGFQAVGDMPPDIALEVPSLPSVGEVSGPVRGDLGIYVIKLTGKQPETTVAFEEVRGDIEGALLKKAHDDAYKDLLERLEQEADIVINDTAVDRIGVKQEEKNLSSN